MLYCNLPQSIVQHIFEFDPTYRQLYSQIIKERFGYLYCGEWNHRYNPTTGHYQYFDSNDGLVYEYYINKGIMDGAMRFFKNGRLLEERGYKESMLEGWCRNYYENGNMKSEMFYSNGREEGVVTYYFENGGLFQKVFYQKGKKHGPLLRYGKSGELVEIRQYKGGRMMHGNSFYVPKV